MADGPAVKQISDYKEIKEGKKTNKKKRVVNIKITELPITAHSCTWHQPWGWNVNLSSHASQSVCLRRLSRGYFGVSVYAAVIEKVTSVNQ